MDNEKYELMNKWMLLQNKGISILQNLKNKGITRIILYGASDFAVRLLEQCENEKCIEVLAVSDKRITSKGGYYKGIPLWSMDDVVKVHTTDICVVITAIGFHKEIAEELKEKGITNFISLSTLIYDCLTEIQ